MIKTLSDITHDNLNMLLKLSVIKPYHKEIFQIIHENNIQYNKNNNGVFVDMSNVNEHVITLIKHFILMKYNEHSIRGANMYMNAISKSSFPLKNDIVYNNNLTNINKTLIFNNLSMHDIKYFKKQY